MKKLFILSTLLLTFGLASAYADIVQIECQLEPITQMSKKYRNRRHKGKHHRHKHHPHLPFNADLKSLNWCGYVAATNLTNPANNSVTSVQGTWVVPTLSPSTTAYSANWVGIDGYTSNTVEQIGTEQDWYKNAQSNYAWFEFYPQYSYELVGFPVDKGDIITAQVTYVGNDVYNLSITNETKQVAYNVPPSYTTSRTAKRSSAEWTTEAPSSNNGVLPFAHISTTPFSNCQATINGVTGPINDNHWVNTAIQMVANATTVKATPSPLTPNGEGFSVVWSHQ